MIHFYFESLDFRFTRERHVDHLVNLVLVCGLTLASKSALKISLVENNSAISLLTAITETLDKISK